MAFRWYNPRTWGFFGYTDPKTGDYVEVDMEVGGKRTKSGVRVNTKTALSISMVWSCVKILSESLSGLPLKLYEDAEGGRKLIPGNDRSLKVLRKPNPYMTQLNFLKFVVVNMALRGNAFALIERNRNGDPIGFVPLDCNTVTIDTDDDLIYCVTPKDSEPFPVSPENMLHFKLFSLDGIVGLSPIEYQAETMGLAKAGQQWSSRFMRKGGFTGGYVIYDQFLTKEQQAQVMERFPDVRKADADDIGKMAILQGGPKIEAAGITQKDAQFIESQQFQEEALAGIYGVPLWLANRAGKTSIMGSNLEQQLTGYITFGLKPYIDAVEDEYNDKVYRKFSRFVEFTVEGLLRADSAGRSTYYGSALGGSGGSGWMTINEVREKENLPPLVGDEYNRVTRWEMQTNVKT
ncbi:phage portal protein [Pseudomonas ficuserectae]|uniref:HK97 family phage portal protein n=2 Tax=Pseudomonas amygdali pv. lachrymans TaxID=53707 RepID=A0AB37R414_PSEAV|nr:phage portal protein [Pseudomonas amygdali]ARA79622.1 phage portal protein [Pseudomonas amygdali pv. lachrymans]AXH54885.1 phage portal protein [Pseudomonas amygdali pv. lachrymans str. M301315]KKY57459.1 nucleoid-structuring protein H-NS [Pseudomonas amygdali pv. lachrymans]PWC99051.1 phage portal protein [Pseudomonas amygdali pv. lachrymans]QWA49153.1 phage portal protein [Pseudomonas amygdali pv. lachrymans]